MAKGARRESAWADCLRAFSLDPRPHQPNPKGGETMKNETKKIVSYRRRCKELGKNTGLSHYILLTPKAK